MQRKKAPPLLGSLVDELKGNREETMPSYAAIVPPEPPATQTEPRRPETQSAPPTPQPPAQAQPPAQSQPQSGTPGKRLALKEAPRTDMPRQTFYVEPWMMRRLKVYAAIDDRGVSEIVREALAAWLEQRERKGLEYED